MSKRSAKLTCGCKYEIGDRERWVEYCPTHQAEVDDLHARWAEEHRQHMARVISGTGNASERRELDALCRGLGAI